MPPARKSWNRPAPGRWGRPTTGTVWQPPAEFPPSGSARSGLQSIVFIAAVEARHSSGRGGGAHAGVDEDADGDRHGALRDQVVEDDRRAPRASVGDEAAAVLKDRHAGGLGRVVLRGNVYPVIARGAGEDLGSGPGVFGDLGLRHVRSPLRIGAESVRLRKKTRRNEDGEEFHSQQ